MIDLIEKRKADFWYQRNNKVKPNISCNVTSFAQCLQILHKDNILDRIPEKFKAGSNQPEDWLYTYLCEDTEMKKFLISSHGTSEIPAPEWADCLIKGANTLAGFVITYFDSILDLKEIIEDLKKDYPVNVSTNLYGGGHRISIVGIKNENTNIPSLLIADPWLKRAEGGIRWIDWPDFEKIRKPYGIRFKNC